MIANGTDIANKQTKKDVCNSTKFVCCSYRPKNLLTHTHIQQNFIRSFMFVYFRLSCFRLSSPISVYIHIQLEILKAFSLKQTAHARGKKKQIQSQSQSPKNQINANSIYPH